MANKKQAVLLIHGIGEQRPMDTLRGFVDTVWTTDEDVKHEYAEAGVFSKPDEISDNFELRRLTTTKNKKNVRTDFYEFYWGHMMPGTTVHHVNAWARQILLRWPWKVPKPLIGTWFLLMAFVLVIAFFALQTVLPEECRLVTISKWWTSAASIFVGLVALPIIKKVIGDAARYLNPAPGNIHRRQEIRAKGVDLLHRLHKSGKYDRIIVVGHSLGSVIGYDILTYAWSKYNEQVVKSKEQPELDTIEEQVADADQDLNTSAYRSSQRKLHDEFAQNNVPWLVTDFLTLGSPLTHAAILLAKDKADLVSKQQERELPTCPPVLESNRFSYPERKKGRILHHAAVFGPTRWANLFFPAKLLVFGDLIGGPLKHLFGLGIQDVRVTTGMRFGLMSHTLYWKQPKSKKPKTVSHITALRKALNLLDEG